MLDDQELRRLLLAVSEDSFVERKTFGDWKNDAVKTVVAFANSVPIGYPGVLFIGVRDNGTPQGGSENLDKIQKTLAELLHPAFPKIYYVCKTLMIEGTQVLAVIVPGSEQRPHFSGPAYVRINSKTVAGSQEGLDELIAKRNSLVRELSKWINKPILLRRAQYFTGTLFKYFEHPQVLVDCNQFYASFRSLGNSATDPTPSFPLSALSISFDKKANSLVITVSSSEFAVW
jgi:hypothetical protein